MAKNTVEVIIAAKDLASAAINKISGVLQTGLKVAAVAAAAAIAALSAAMFKGVQAAKVQEDAELKLAAAMRSTGTATQENYRHLTQYASGLQKVTKFGDEATLQAQALLMQLGNLRGEGLDKATMASADLASALGMTIEQAAMLIAKGAEMPSMLSRYGIRVDENIPKGEKFNAVLAEIEKKFGGSAQAMVNNYSGQMAQLSNTVGDTFEKLGSLITRNTVVIEVIGVAKDAFEKLGEMIETHRETILNFVKTAMVKLLEGLLLLVEMASMVHEVFSGEVNPAFESTSEAVEKLIEKIKKMKAVSNNAAEALIGNQEQVREAFWETADAQTELEENRALMTELAEKRRQEAIKITQAQQLAGIEITAAVGNSMITIAKSLGAKGKVIALSTAIIQTAVAVARALASGPPPFNLIQAKLVGALGAIQIATIAATKMARGGIVTAPTLVLAGEAGPEAIVPLTGEGRGVGGSLVFRGNINVATADKMSEMTDSEIDEMLERQLLPGLDRLARRGITVTT